MKCFLKQLIIAILVISVIVTGLLIHLHYNSKYYLDFKIDAISIKKVEIEGDSCFMNKELYELRFEISPVHYVYGKDYGGYPYINGCLDSILSIKIGNDKDELFLYSSSDSCEIKKCYFTYDFYKEHKNDTLYRDDDYYLSIVDNLNGCGYVTYTTRFMLVVDKGMLNPSHIDVACMADTFYANVSDSVLSMNFAEIQYYPIVNITKENTFVHQTKR